MNCLEHAQNYIKQGFNVVPLKLDGSKKTIIPWKTYQTRLASPQELEEWFGRRNCGIGVVAGAISGNLHVLDFDHDAELYFTRFWGDIQDQLPGITDKLINVVTPRPGRQIWFRQTSEPPANQVLAYSERQPTGEINADGQPILLPQLLIETRGTGGYVCAVGSPPATHKSGRPYVLVYGSFESLPLVSDEEAATMITLCRSYSEYTPQPVHQRTGEPYQGEPRPGNIFNQHTDLRSLLIEAGWQSHHVDDGAVEYLTRPGKQVSEGHSASLGYIRSNDGKPLFYVFTANAVPFQDRHCYDAFGAYTAIEHDGDFAKAAAAAQVQFAEQLKEAKTKFREKVTNQLPDATPFVPFPTDLLPEVVQRYVDEHAAAIGIDSSYVAVPMLSVLAGLIGQSRGLQLKRTWQIPCIVWAVTIGDVSSGKTPGWDAAVAPAMRIEAALHREKKRQDEDFHRRNEAYKRASDGGDRFIEKPTKENFTNQLVINDTTMETLIDIHSNNTKLILACDELAGWLRSMDLYRGGVGRDVQNWLSIYNGGAIQVNRKTESYRVYLPKTSISVCGTIQPAVAAETLFTERFIENGFAARILCVQPPRKVVRWSEREVPDSVDSAMFELADQLYALLPAQVDGDYRTLMLTCDDDAKKAFIQFDNDTADHTENMDTVLRSAWSKLRPMAARLALIFSVIRQLQQYPAGQATQPVDAEDMKAGIELAWWFGRELERNYGTGKDTAIQDHLAWITSNHHGGVDARALLAGRRGIKTADDARIVMQKLTQQGCGRLEGSKFIPNGVST